jgi:hypothetical protein
MRSLTIVAFLALCSCSATIPPVEVTRFTTGQQIAAGPVAVVPALGSDSQSLEFRTYASAVARQLASIGYPEERDQSSPYIAEIAYSRGTRAEAAKRSPISIGIGGGSFGRGGGIGIGTSIGLGGGRRETAVMMLSVRLKSRASGQAVWEGRAQTEATARSPAAQPGLSADKLAAALFNGFPGKSGETIIVP